MVKDITKQTVDYFILNLNNTELESSIIFNDLSTVKEYMDLFLVDLQKNFDLINPLELMQPKTNIGKYLNMRR